MTERDLKKIRAIAFDFGGTLDIPGIHWFDFFWSQFDGRFTGDHAITKEQYWDAYVYGERQMEKYGIPRDTDFYDTITKKLFYQFEYLADKGLPDMIDLKSQAFAEIFKTYGIPQIEANLQTAAMIFKALCGKYDLSIVSNYYGNLEVILKEAKIFPYLNRLLDSTIIGIRKPDPAIWKLALDQSGCKPEEFLIVGDSMKNDILPARSLGCPTIWITKELPPEGYEGDWVSSLEMLAKFLNIELTT